MAAWCSSVLHDMAVSGTIVILGMVGVVVVNVVVVVVTGDRLLAINWTNDGRERIITIATGWRYRVDAVG